MRTSEGRSLVAGNSQCGSPHPAPPHHGHRARPSALTSTERGSPRLFAVVPSSIPRDGCGRGRTARGDTKVRLHGSSGRGGARKAHPRGRLVAIDTAKHTGASRSRGSKSEGHRGKTRPSPPSSLNVPNPFSPIPVRNPAELANPLVVGANP